MRWILLLLESDVEILDRKGNENQITVHLSWISNKDHASNDFDINKVFLDLNNNLLCV